MNMMPKRMRALLVLALVGLAVGFAFDWLARRPSLKTFFFLSCKLCGPTLAYWIFSDLFFVLGLILAFAIVRISGTAIRPPSVARSLAAVVVGALNLGFYLFRMTPSISFFGIVIAPFLFMLILIAALRVLTAEWDNVSACLIILSPIVMLGLSAAMSLFMTSGGVADRLIGPIHESLLFAAAGLWLIRSGGIEIGHRLV
jgi:hypothetical protein